MKAAAFVAVIGAALLLRALFPSADPPVRLSWSNGLFTDPPSIVLGARDDVRFGDWRAGGERGHAFYPLWNGIARIAFGRFGPTRDVLQFTGALWATIAVLAGALAAGRAGVSRLGAAVTLGGCAWLAEFGRIPLPEHLATALLAAAAWFALGERSREYAAAGVLAGVAAWFAKPQSVFFLPAAAAFLVVRRGSAGPLLAFGGGIGLATVLWFATVAPWAHRDLLDQWREAGTLYGAFGSAGELALAPFRAFRTSWVFHRMPLLGALGATFAVAAVALPGVRRSAHRSGVALFGWWFLTTWIGASLLPYAAPRYFVPAVFALMPCAVAAIAGLARFGARAASPIPTWFTGVVAWAAGVAAIEAIAQWSTELTDSVLSPGTRLAAWVTSFGDGWASFFAAVPVEVGVAAAFAGLALGVQVVARSRIAVTGRVPVRFLVVAIGLVQLGQLAWFFSQRADHLARAACGFDVALPAEAVAWGGLAPALAFDGPRVAKPQFGPATWAEVVATDATHLVLAVPGELDTATREGWLDSLQWIARWPLRGPHLAAVDVYRVRGTEDRVPPSELERAVVALEGEDWSAAREALAAAPDDSPDVWRLRAVAAVGEGRFGDAEAALGEVLGLEPRSSEDWYRLGNLRAARGDAEGASAAWREGLAIDPFHPDLRATGVGSSR